MSDAKGQAAGAPPAPPGRWARITTYGRLVRFSHTLFALPWALAGLWLGSQKPWPEPMVLLKVLLCMVGARTAAMAYNRYADRDIDATNPRTAQRPSVTGEVSPGGMLLLIGLAGALFVGGAYWLNPLCGMLSWPCLAIVLGYSHLKRHTSLAHYGLGVALGLAPLSAYLAASGSFEGAGAAACLGVAVLLWTAGFDVLYACQDVAHDRSEKLNSVPARVGVARALHIAAWTHACVPPALVAAGLFGALGVVWWITVALVTLLLAYEHRLVRPEDLSRLDVAFFRVNVAIAVAAFVAIVVESVLAGGLSPGAAS